ncbi:MAG: hypothetical protein ACKO1M_09955, partial [Planctomycetota bacterium]
RIYHAIGARIRRRDFEVLDERVRVSTLEKFRLFGLALLAPAGIGRRKELDETARRALAAAERLVHEHGVLS